MARKRRNFTEVLLIFLTVLVFLAIFTVVLALVYPNAAKNVLSDASRSFESSRGGPVGAVGAVLKRAGEGFNARIAPAIKWVGSRLAELRSPKKEVKKITEQPKGRPFKAKDCVGCHQHEALFDQTAVGNIYIDHRLHAAREIKCEECHVNTKHPKPKSVEKATCINCHKETRASVDCATCHPRGSILDNAVMPKEMTEEFLHNRPISTKSLLPHNFGTPDPGWLRGEGDPPCRNCHNLPDFCNTCHLVFHARVANWPEVHGPRLMRKEYIMAACWDCHSATWCAGNCHINQGTKRSGPYLQLPSTPLEPYVR